MNEQAKRLDMVINRLCAVRNTITHNPEIEFDVNNLISIVEVSTSTLAEEIDDEMEG